MSRQRLETICRNGASWYAAGPSRIVARIFGDTKIVLDPEDFSLTPHLAMDGFWESWVSLWAMNNTTGDDRVLNVGANCGYFTLLFAREGARVVAVEPQGKLVNNLKLSLALNGYQERVEVRQCVAGSERRVVPFQEHKHFGGSAFVGTESGVEWRGSSVSEVAAHELMPDANCVFIDAEGYEPQIWAGLKPLLDRGQLDWVTLEWAPARYHSPADFISSMRGYGDLYIVRDDGREAEAKDSDLLCGDDEWATLVVRRK